MDFLIRDTRLLLTKNIEALIARYRIPIRAWFPLRILKRHQGITQRELGEMLGYGDAHAGVIVREMEMRRLIERRRSTADRRRIELYLTTEGRKMARQTSRLQRAVNAKIVAGFSAAEARTLQALLRRAHENLRPP